MLISHGRGPCGRAKLEQIDLDAELARQLAEEDERQYRRERAGPREPTQQPSQPVPVTYQAYVPKNRRRATVDNAQQGHGSWQPPSTSQANEGQQRQQQQQADDRDELDMLAENLSVLPLPPQLCRPIEDTFWSTDADRPDPPRHQFQVR